jgi:hypothetical protein
MLRTVVHATSNDRCLHRCCGFVCGMLRAACVQHSVFRIRKRTGVHTGALFLPPGRGSQRGLGQRARGMAHIFHGIERLPFGRYYNCALHRGADTPRVVIWAGWICCIPAPLNVSCRGFLRCWWARIPMFCVMLEFWRLLLLVLDPFAATFDVA